MAIEIFLENEIQQSYYNFDYANTDFIKLNFENCEKESEQNLDPGEDIEVDVVSETEVNDHIDKGIIRHSLVLSAFRLYEIVKKK